MWKVSNLYKAMHCLLLYLLNLYNYVILLIWTKLMTTHSAGFILLMTWYAYREWNQEVLDIMQMQIKLKILEPENVYILNNLFVILLLLKSSRKCSFHFSPVQVVWNYSLTSIYSAVWSGQEQHSICLRTATQHFWEL